ncbi:hypothetical protein JCGZ_05989 [Jatropha curcas]|uniref:Aminotransferase-like plant mobile domain-containing protein n=1 Tax=Jatropha curcas TaxID=180498 RepID=A0A067KZ53_JATCU|nr:hypothetical protein JCGZ_05989 [Jatropha curcas]
MSQLPEILASAYTSEMNTLGPILDIPIFEGERVPVSRNALTPGTRPLQLLPLPDTEFPVRHKTDAMRSFQTESRTQEGVTCAAVLGEHLRDATVRSVILHRCFKHSGICWTPPMRSRVIAAGFGDYAVGLRRTQPRFSPAMRYTLMERWNDCTHMFIFGFGEMTLTPVDYTTITGLRFDDPIAPLDARYQTAALGAELVRTLLGVPTRTRYTAQGELPEDVRPTAPAYTREERDQAARSFIFYLISSQLLYTSQNKGDPAVLACLRDLGRVGSYSWASLALAHLYHGLDVWTRCTGESNWQFLWPLELLLTPWEGDAWEAYPGRAVAEAYTRSRSLLQGYWLDRYFLGERIYELQVATAQRRVPNAPPHHMCLLEGMTPEDLFEEYDGSPADIPLSAGDYASYFSTRL